MTLSLPRPLALTDTVTYSLFSTQLPGVGVGTRRIGTVTDALAFLGHTQYLTPEIRWDLRFTYTRTDGSTIQFNTYDIEEAGNYLLSEEAEVQHAAAA